MPSRDLASARLTYCRSGGRDDIVLLPNDRELRLVELLRAILSTRLGQPERRPKGGACPRLVFDVDEFMCEENSKSLRVADRLDRPITLDGNDRLVGEFLRRLDGHWPPRNVETVKALIGKTSCKVSSSMGMTFGSILIAMPRMMLPSQASRTARLLSADASLCAHLSETQKSAMRTKTMFKNTILVGRPLGLSVSSGLPDRVRLQVTNHQRMEPPGQRLDVKRAHLLGGCVSIPPAPATTAGSNAPAALCFRVIIAVNIDSDALSRGSVQLGK